MTDCRSQTSLQLSVAKPGGLSIARMLVQAGADLDTASRYRYKSPLMIAVDNRDMEATRFLDESGADIDFFSNRSPLQIAVEAGHLEIIKLLLSEGTNPNIGTRSGSSPWRDWVRPNYLQLPLNAAPSVATDGPRYKLLPRPGTLSSSK